MSFLNKFQKFYFDEKLGNINNENENKCRQNKIDGVVGYICKDVTEEDLEKLGNLEFVLGNGYGYVIKAKDLFREIKSGSESDSSKRYLENTENNTTNTTNNSTDLENNSTDLNNSADLDNSIPATTTTTVEKKSFEFLLKFTKESNNLLTFGYPFSVQFMTVFNADEGHVGFFKGETNDYTKEWIEWDHSDDIFDEKNKLFYMMVGAGILGALLLILVLFIIVHSVKKKRADEHGPFLNEENN